MGDLKLFRIDSSGSATELPGTSVKLEKRLQDVIERNMDVMFGVQFLESEYSTGAKHGGRIDSLGIDDTGSPVIFEYKRNASESVINQGLFYLDWLLDHKAEFEMLVMRKRGLSGDEVSDAVDWTAPRVICVANDFTKYDEHAVQQMGRAIELVRYQDFMGELLTLDLVTTVKSASAVPLEGKGTAPRTRGKTATEFLEQAPPHLKALHESLVHHIESLGDDVTATVRKDYFAYRRIRNFACVEVRPQSSTILVYLKINPDDVDLIDGFTRDVREIGHFGTGDLEVRITNENDLEAAFPLVEQSYRNS